MKRKKTSTTPPSAKDKQTPAIDKDWSKDGKPPFKVDKYGNVEQRKPSTKVFDKTQEWIELERGKGSGLSMNDLREAAEEQQKLEDTERLRETLQAREERKEEERLANDRKGFLSAIDKLEAERRARDN